MHSTDIRPIGVQLYLLPIDLRLPLKFGAETLTSVVCARVCVRVRSADGREAEGWGETPLSVQWVWPSDAPYGDRYDAIAQCCRRIAQVITERGEAGHPIEVSSDFEQQVLPAVIDEVNAGRDGRPPLPYLAALLCFSAFDIAMHDAFGRLVGLPVYQTYGCRFMNRDLGDFLTPAGDAQVSFKAQYPSDYLVDRPATKLAAWHLVGGLDKLTGDELDDDDPNDGYPVVLTDWIKRDGLRCLKVKLRGTDAAWDYQRLVDVGQIAIDHDVDWLSADFNCTVGEPAYVNEILDRLRDDRPRIYGMVLYVEQPFAYDLEANRIDVRSVAARKPLFMDESAHNWRYIELGRSLGWSAAALKTCKTQTGALLSLCWAKAHGMPLMVQDLTNPMLAQIPHVLLAAHAGTIMGVETNGMQFYPAASAAEAKVHGGLYERRDGCVDLSTVQGAGFGYRVEEMDRALPDAERI